MEFNFHNQPGWRKKSVEDAFREKYIVVAESGCWIWVASCFRTGYGQFNPRNGRVVTAHRYSYELAKGQVPDGVFVCHRCDVRECVNPDHLFLGTAKENSADMVRKGRSPKRNVSGDTNPSAKITATDAQRIYKSRQSVKSLASKYGLTRQAIHAIKKRKTWRKATEIFGV